MDPITHGLIGAAAGLAVLAAAKPEASLRERRLAALCGLLGGEAPDLDRVIDLWFAQQWDDGGGLAYMLYHRGLTHSVLACLLFAALIAGGTRLFTTAKTPRCSWVFLAALAGGALHLAMDATNDYGVHPFFPLSRRWFYGDFLFLGEPLVSAPLLPHLLVALGLGRRHVLPLCLAAGVAWFGYGALSHWLSWWGFAVALSWLVLHGAIQLRWSSAAAAWAGYALALGLFFGCAQIAQARGAAALAALGEAKTSSDIITTPQGANPLCFRVIAVTRSNDQFRVRLGVTSLLPPLVDPNTCFAPPEGPVPRSVCITRIEKNQPAPVVWLATFAGSVSQFEAWAAQSPRVDATRHFLRAPFWGPDARQTECTPDGVSQPGGPKVLIGDMRVDYAKEDLAHFCKYAFLPGDTEPLDPIMPLGAPPFFVPVPAAPATELAIKP